MQVLLASAFSMIMLASNPASSAPAEPAPKASDLLSVAITDIKISSQMPRELSATFSTAIAEELEKTAAFKTISSQEIIQMLDHEGQKQLLACSSDVSCLTDIGGALGTDYLLTGSVLQVDEAYLIQLQLIDIANAKVANRVSREFKGGPLALVQDLRVATLLLARPVMKQSQGSLLVQCKEEGASIKINDAIVGVTPLAEALSLAQGMHTLEVSKSGFILFRRDVHVEKDKTLTVNVVLQPSQEYINNYRSMAQNWRIGAWSATGLGLVSLAASGGLFALSVVESKALTADIKAYNDQSQRSDEDFSALNRRGHDIGIYEGVALTTGLVGLLVAVTGGLLFVFGPDVDRYSSTKDSEVAAPVAVKTFRSAQQEAGGPS